MKTIKHVTLIVMAFLLISFIPNVAATVSGTWVYQPYDSQRIIRGVTFIDSQTGCAVGNYGIILTTSNGGDDWIIQDSGVDVHFYGVSFPDSLHGWVCGYIPGDVGGFVYSTSDGGVTWIEQLHVPGAIFLDIDFIDLSKGWVVGKGGIWYTSDGGSSWTKQYGDNNLYLGGSSFVDALHGWAVGSIVSPPRSLILATSDGGETWIEQCDPIFYQGSAVYLDGVSFVDLMHGTIVGRHGTILTTYDGGLTWNRITIDPVKHLTAVSFVDSFYGWIAGDDVILETTDGGGSWSKYQMGGYRFRDVFFFDKSHGWTVGFFNYGAILSYSRTSELIDMDIKPGNDLNRINAKSKGRIQVAVLSSYDFDATKINSDTIVFAGAAPIRWSVKDVNNDGFGDMLFFFKTVDTYLGSNSIAASLTGETIDYMHFQGTDSVNIVP